MPREASRPHAELKRNMEEFRARRAALQRTASEVRVRHLSLTESYGFIKARFAEIVVGPGDEELARLAGAKRQFATLSPRQVEVLHGVLAGKPNKEIAYDLRLSQKTVETHRARVMQKLAVTSLPALVRLAIAAGIA